MSRKYVLAAALTLCILAPISAEASPEPDVQRMEENIALFKERTGITDSVSEQPEEQSESSEKNIGEFRFTETDDAPIVIVKKGTSVYEEKDSSSKIVGRAASVSIGNILEDDGEWAYVESETVRGFIQKKDLVAEGLSSVLLERNGADDYATMTEVVNPSENKAMLYSDKTAERVIEAEHPAVALGTVEVKEGRSDEDRTVGTLENGGLMYILSDVEKGWLYVESGDVRGFVKKKTVITGKAAEMIADTTEDPIPAKETVSPSDNKALYYTMKSTRKADAKAYIREEIVRFAEQFVGNPYVWGGTSLTNGADCSGFVLAVFSHFGYSLPRVAEDQARVGTRIPLSDAQAGDLIFYQRADGYVYHVALCSGSGTTVQAQSTRTGIVDTGFGNASFAVSII